MPTVWMLGAVVLALSSERACRYAKVDVCEVNHVIKLDGSTRFTQIILWRWVPLWADHHVSQWMIVCDDSLLVERKGPRKIITWRDNRGRCYSVNARTFRETFTRNDPEMDDREVFGEDKRVPYFR